MSIGNQQLLRRYAKPVFISSATDDLTAPFSFKDWYDAYQGIIPGQEFNQYNEYLVDWYKTKSEQTVDFNLTLKLNYLTLLKQLQLFFSREEAENWYNQVNLDNEKELLLAIPYFARKLKDISLFYLQLRNNIKESRLRYNQTGTNFGIIQQLQKLLLTNYTKKPNSSISLPSSIWRDVPELSSVKDFISVQIEELYDVQDYFDQVPTLPVSAYYSVNDTELQKFLETKGLEISDTEWIYKVGANFLSANFVNLSSENISDLSLQLTEKYLGQNKFLSTVNSISSQIDLYDIGLNKGNNYFYWPTGAYRSKANILPRYKEVDINSSGLETVATAGSSIETADTIFIQTTRGLSGAWFRNFLYDNRTANLEALLEPSTKTVFRFPFPGYGLSAEDIDWTGYGLTYEPRFFFLENSIQQNILNQYWSNSIDLTSTKPLNINDSTLIYNGAYPNIDYNRADKITIWTNPPQYNETSFSGDVTEAWLYRMNQTDISIGFDNNVIVWPYEKIDPLADFPNYYGQDLTDVCTTLPVSTINFSYAVAANTLSAADIIYKLTNYRDTIDTAVECCWLSGGTTQYPDNKLQFTKQNNFQLLLASGTYTSFVWPGNDLINAENVFKTIKHQSDCPFVKTANLTYLDYTQCSCKQVMFTPFGHPGNQYDDYNSFTDFIIEGEYTPGITDITNFVSTSAFAWYKTNSKIGFGDGRWVSGELSAGNQFYLQQGKTYTYYRSLVPQLPDEDSILPDYVVRYKLNLQSENDRLWVRAIKDAEGSWISTGRPTAMTLAPGDIILYSRAATTNYTITGTVLQTVDVSENRGSIWANYDYVTVDSKTDKQIFVTYPFNTYASTSSLNAQDFYKQYPELGPSNLVQVRAWSLTYPDGTRQIFQNTTSFNFIPTLTGLYRVAVTATSSAQIPPQFGLAGLSGTFFYLNTGLFIFSNIPPITAEPILQNVPTLTSYNTPVPGYTLNTKLYGWDYSSNKTNQYARSVNAGAKPYWAKSYIQKDQATGFKGINAWGTPQRFVDAHNVITQPEISELVINTGDKIEYTRNYSSPLTWIQPIDLTVTVNTNSWCNLEFNTSPESNLSYFLENYKNKLVITPTSAASQIKFRNYIDNEPEEVFYNAINPFVWSITAIPLISETVYDNISALIGINAASPWANLSNRCYPTVAAFPAVNNLYSDSDIGGFFAPKNLGAGIYINRDYSATLSLTSSALSSYFQDITKQYSGRGLTKEEQPTPYENLVENNIWLKEPTVAGPIAGTIKKKIFKKYQKFIPYQSGYESNPRSRIGLLNPTSRQSPWTGKEDSEWGDLQNYPLSPTGELNVQNWADSQILKQNKLQIDNWCTDVFGNQYGLYKALSGTTPHTRKFVSGEIWVRKNSQFTAPSYIELKNVFDTYQSSSLVHELTGKGIRRIDMFFDTLLIETSGTIIFEKINYDYTNDNIFSLTDEARYISLAMPVSANLDREFANINLSNFTFAQAGETWFFPNEKLVTQSVCGLTNSILTPELYQLDLNTQIFKKIFPVNSADIATINELVNLNLASIEPPTLSHNSLRKEYLLTILGKDANNKITIIEIKIKDLTQLYIDEVIVYNSLNSTQPLNPPVITQSLRTDLSITNIEYQNALDFQCVAENGPVTFEPVSVPSWINLSPTGRFTGTPPFQTTQYIAEFKVSNSVGPSYYSLIININYTEILTIYYFATEGYELSGGNGFMVQEEHDLGDIGNGLVARIIE